MALTELQRRVCRLIAANRIAGGESNIDLFHDTEEALDRSWRADRVLLQAEGYAVAVLRERPSHIQAEISQGTERILAEWVRDSAYRFFPLVEHAELGLTLHPFDLATNRVLALVGRVEVRDWVDVIECDSRLQPLGYLAWAACGKDPDSVPPPSCPKRAGRAATRWTRYDSSRSRDLSVPRGTRKPVGAHGKRPDHDVADARLVHELHAVERHVTVGAQARGSCIQPSRQTFPLPAREPWIAFMTREDIHSAP